jgi:hypothetical protein
MSHAEFNQQAALEKVSQVMDLDARLSLERNIKLGNIASQADFDAALQDIALVDLNDNSTFESDSDYASELSTVDRLNALAKKTRTLLEGYRQASDLRNDALKKKLYDLVKGHNALGYSGARKFMYGYVDNYNGKCECVYTGELYPYASKPNLSTKDDEDENNSRAKAFMNCEHTWPQSFFDKKEPMRSDIWHLYPTNSDANGRRSSYPFGDVKKVTWSSGGSKLGSNSKGKTVFEPRDCHKGNVARSLFYFCIRYNDSLDADQENTLRQWHKLDPVDARERERANRIEERQNNRNPFIDHPEYVSQIDNF